MTKWSVVRQVSLIGILGVAVVGATAAANRKSDLQKFFDPIIDVKKLIDDRYVYEVKEEELRDGAIRGMLEVLNDPYTVYVPAADVKEFTKDLTGEYSGIGASVRLEQGWLTIETPLEDSPAFRAGIMPDDRVVDIDGKSTFGMSVDACVDILTGKEGTPVSIIIEREGQKIPMTLIRQKIKTKSVKGFHRDPSDAAKWQFVLDQSRGIAYIRMTQFTPGLGRELVEALIASGVNDGKLKGIVLDLRYNPGGLLSEAVQIADLFLKSGTIVSTRGRAFREEVVTAIERGTMPQDIAVAVLVNGQSASASEVLAGALVENDRAVVVGVRTFGKGSVQQVQDLPTGDGAELKITEQGYYLPSGRSIHRKDDSATWGVDPSKGFYVPMTDEEQIEMLRIRREEEQLHANGKPAEKEASADQRWADTDWVLERMKDKQLTAAVRAVQQKIDTGEWKPTGEEGIDATKIAADELKRLILSRDLITKDLIRLQRRIQAVETAAGDEAKSIANPDLWANDLDLRGGTVTVKDKDGKVVSTLDITGRDLERWLSEAEVKVEPAPGTAPTAKADETKPDAAKPDAAKTDEPAPAPGK